MHSQDQTQQQQKQKTFLLHANGFQRTRAFHSNHFKRKPSEKQTLSISRAFNRTIIPHKTQTWASELYRAIISRKSQNLSIIRALQRNHFEKNPNSRNWLHEKACIIWPRNPKANDENSSNSTKHWAWQSNHFMENPKPETACMKKLAPFGQANPKQNDEDYNNPTIHWTCYQGFSKPPLNGKPKTRNSSNERPCIIWSRKPKPKPKWSKLQQLPKKKHTHTKLL